MIAVNDGASSSIGHNKRLGRYVMLQDVYGNTYTYAHLGKVARTYPAPKPQEFDPSEVQRAARAADARRPAADAASATERPARRARSASSPRRPRPTAGRPPRADKERLFAHPARPNASAAGGAQQEFERTGEIDGEETVAGYFRRVFGLGRKDIELKRLRRGLARRRRHDPRPPRRPRGPQRSVPAVRDPAGRPRRPADRPEADPRRLEAARVDRHLPRHGQEPVLRPRRREPVDRPDPADEQGGARAARARQPADRDLRLRRQRHPHRPDRPPRARDARVPRRLAACKPTVTSLQVRPRLPDRLGQRVRALDRHRGRHRARSTASRSRRPRRARARSPT